MPFVGVEGFGIADVGAVEKAKEVNRSAQRNDAQILFPYQSPDSRRVCFFDGIDVLSVLGFELDL